MALENIPARLIEPGDLKQYVGTKSTATTHELIAAVAGKRIVIYTGVINCAGTVKLTLLSAANTMRVINHVDGKRITFLREEFFMTNVGEALNILLGGAVATDIRFVHYLI